MTNKLYKQDVYLKSIKTKISEVTTDNTNTYVTLEDTIFFPEGGGQSSDIGILSLKPFDKSPIDNPALTIENSSTSFIDDCEYSIIHVKEGENPIHTIEGTHENIYPGSTAFIKIDWEHRFDNMQRHCGEHVLSGTIYRLFGGINKGFHMGKDYMTIDILLPAERDKITWEMAMTSEFESNKVIWQNLPVNIDYFDRRNEAEKLPLRKPLAFDKDISIATIGSYDNPADCVACCGSHPSRTGEIGMIKVYKIEANKGMSRIYFDAGKRVLLNYQNQFNSLYDIGVLLSSGYSEIVDKYKVQLKKQEEQKEELTKLKKLLVDIEVTKIIPELRPGFIAYYNQFSIEDLFNIGKKIRTNCSGVIALVSSPYNIVVLISAGDKLENHCGNIIKTLAGKYDGKGGGSKESARAVFSNSENMKAFLFEFKALHS